MNGADILTFLGKLPPEAFKLLGGLFSAILAGDTAKAERAAKAAAQAVALRQLGRQTARALRR
jgi:hypothetical protein